MSTVIGGVLLALFGAIFALAAPIVYPVAREDGARKWGVPPLDPSLTSKKLLPWLFRVAGVAFCGAGIVFAATS